MIYVVCTGVLISAVCMTIDQSFDLDKIGLENLEIQYSYCHWYIYEYHRDNVRRCQSSLKLYI